jgi:hypothetical protein
MANTNVRCGAPDIEYHFLRLQSENLCHPDMCSTVVFAVESDLSQAASECGFNFFLVCSATRPTNLLSSLRKHFCSALARTYLRQGTFGVDAAYQRNISSKEVHLPCLQ